VISARRTGAGAQSRLLADNPRRQLRRYWPRLSTGSRRPIIIDRGPPICGVGQRRGNPNGALDRPLGDRTSASDRL